MAFTSSQGSKLQVSIASTLTDIPQLTEFQAPGIERRFKDVTTLDASGNFAVYQPLMNDTSTATAKGYWDPDNSVHDFLMDEAILAVGVLDAWKALWTNTGASFITFNGYVMKFQPTTSQNDVLGFDLEIRVSGAPSYTQ